jgi:uncharacterized protein YbaP (TraB family)
MKTFRFFSLLIITLFSWIQSQSQLLWSIDKKGYQKTSYLYGTIHEGDSSVIAWDEKFTEIFYGCELFMSEIDLTQKDEMGNIMTTLLSMGMRDSSEVISPALKDSIDEIQMAIAKEYDPETAAQLIQMKPILSSIQLMSLSKIKNGNLHDEMMNKMESSYEYNVMPDWVLTEMAQNAGLNIRGIETPEDQINALFKIPMHVQWKALYDVMIHPDTTVKGTSDIKTLMNIYKQQDLVKLNQYIMDASLPVEIARELIVVRNYNMLASIEDILPDQESVFFAVGAGHLGGDEGLIQLLKNKGFQVNPVHYKWVTPTR